VKPGDLVRLRESALRILGDRFIEISNTFIVLDLKPYPTRSDWEQFKQNIEVLAPDGNLLILLSDFFEVIDEAG
jgi:hypothetical protein